MALVLVDQKPVQDNSVHEIFPDVYLGNCDSRLFINTLGIRSVVQIGTAEEHQEYIPIDPTIQLLKITVQDSHTSHIEDYFDSVAQYASQAPKPILFHCNAGVSRSPTLLTAYLVSFGHTVTDVLKTIQEKRTFNSREAIYTCPKPRFIRKLNQYMYNHPALADT